MLKAGLAELLAREPESAAGEKDDEQKYKTEVSSMQPSNDLNTTKRDR